MISKKELKNLKKKIDKLEKKDIDLIISDFDDTIFSRKEQLEKSELLRNNRGKKGNEVMKNIIGFENIINDYYKNKIYPKTIISKLRKNHDLILTAGDKELQSLKIKTCGLENINHIIVENAENKILETFKYVINKLGFIPSKIIIYEDKPEYFIEYRKIIEQTLQTKLEIMFVEMYDNYTEAKITKK